MSEEEKNVYKNLFEYPTKIITSLELEKDNLIKYLEDKINSYSCYPDYEKYMEYLKEQEIYKNILERVNSGKYE